MRRFGPLGTGSPRTATSTFKQLLELCAEHMQVQVQCCFTSTETIRTIWDWEPRAATSAFTKLRSSVGCFQIDSPVILFPDPERCISSDRPVAEAKQPRSRQSVLCRPCYASRSSAEETSMFTSAVILRGRMRTFRSAITLRTDANV